MKIHLSGFSGTEKNPEDVTIDVPENAITPELRNYVTSALNTEGCVVTFRLGDTPACIEIHRMCSPAGWGVTCKPDNELLLWVASLLRSSSLTTEAST